MRLARRARTAELGFPAGLAHERSRLPHLKGSVFVIANAGDSPRRLPIHGGRRNFDGERGAAAAARRGGRRHRIARELVPAQSPKVTEHDNYGLPTRVQVDRLQ